MRRWSAFARGAIFGVLFAAMLTPARGDSPAQAPPVPVAMYSDTGAFGKGPRMLVESFHKDTEFRVIPLKADHIRAGGLKHFRVLIMPGGSNKSQATKLGPEGREAIKAFIENGGTYVGICAGCYLATCQYPYSLHVLPAKIKDPANWLRGRANLTLALTDDGKDWLSRTDAKVKSVYHNGPILEALPDATTKLIPLAIYKEEITRKGAEAGVMVNTPAIVASRYGKGWVIGVSPHPEQTDDLKDLIPAAIRRALR